MERGPSGYLHATAFVAVLILALTAFHVVSVLAGASSLSLSYATSRLLPALQIVGCFAVYFLCWLVLGRPRANPSISYWSLVWWVIAALFLMPAWVAVINPRLFAWLRGMYPHSFLADPSFSVALSFSYAWLFAVMTLYVRPTSSKMPEVLRALQEKEDTRSHEGSS